MIPLLQVRSLSGLPNKGEKWGAKVKSIKGRGRVGENSKDDLYYLEVCIPGIPESFNKNLRKHFHQRKNQNHYWYNLVKVMVGKNLPKLPLKKAKIKLVRHYYRFLDWDGAVASMKPLVDGLIHARVIKDDSYKVTGPWDVTQEFLPKKEGGYVYMLISGYQRKDAGED